LSPKNKFVSVWFNAEAIREKSEKKIDTGGPRNAR